MVRKVPAVLFGLLVLCTWWVASTFGWVNPAFLPTPQSVLERVGQGLVKMNESGPEAGYLALALKNTLAEALAGCLIAALAGIPLGYAIAKSRLFSSIIQPYLAASQAVPAVAIAPLLVVWIGYGFVPVVVLCVIMVIFPIIVSTSVGITQLDRDVLGAARLDGAHGWSLFRRIELPMAGPSVLAGIRTGFTLSVTGAVVGEMIIGGNGLGTELTRAQSAADVRGLFAVVVVMAAAAISLYSLLYYLENRANAAAGVTRAAAHKRKVRP